MVKPSNMWRYVRTVKVAHHHDGNPKGELTWETVTASTPSPAQGWDFTLECGCKLQYALDLDVEVQMILLDEVANWGR